MNQEIKKLWIEALTSGKYNQGTGALKGVDSFCCLGVLCDLYIQKNEGNKWEEDNSYLGEKDILPETVMNWAGLNDQNPDVQEYSSLAEMNDDGYTFKEIAQIIETEL